MKIALIAPPFIPVPPERYGGTELFVAHLAEGLVASGHEVVVYAVRSSRVRCEVRGWYDQPDWPLTSETTARFRNHVHTVRSVRDVLDSGFDVVHVQDALAVPMQVLLPMPMVYTVHHPYEPDLSALYAQFPEVYYVTISRFQQTLERFQRTRTIHHGVRAEDYTVVERKQPYLSFLGRIAPVKGPHLAIEAARRAGIPLKLAGEIQPLFRDYWETQIKPHVDGRFIEYLGEADHRLKNELLGHSMACLFPIQWNEPFGLVMIEAMACGTPVLALPGGSVPEVVHNGVSGWICADVAELARRAADPGISPLLCRRYVEQRFSLARMVADYESLYAELAAAPAAADLASV